MIELVGYHGTIKTNAEKILSSGIFKESNEKDDWLGHGIYFFADVENAIKWANERANRYNEEAVVLSVNIKCDMNRYLNLDYQFNRRKVSLFFKDIINKSDKDISFYKRDEEKRCIACDLYKDFFGIYVIEFTFSRKVKKGHSEDKDILGFSSVPEKQICVSNHQCISNIKIVRGDKYVEGI